MDKGLITEQTLSDIASAIRDVYGEKDTYYPSEFADKIRGLVVDPYTQGLWVDYGNGYVAYNITGTSITYNLFRSNASLIRARWEQCTEIGDYAFMDCSSLTEISFPACTYISISAFGSDIGLETVNFPKCTSMSDESDNGGYEFWSCWGLKTASFPECTYIPGWCFAQCSSLVSISAPKASYIGSYAFRSCYALPYAAFPMCTFIGASAFATCSALSALYLTGSSQIVSIKNSNVFNGTSANFKVYVRDSMYSSYLTAQYWSQISSYLSIIYMF